MNNRVTDITNARDDGDSAGIVVGAAVSRPFTSLDPNVYSVIYETKIGSDVLAKRSRAEHFKKANEKLLFDVNSDRDFNDLIESLVLGFRRIEGTKVPTLGISPSTFTTWHHLPQSDRLN